MIIHYSPNHDLPNNVINFDEIVNKLGKAKAIETINSDVATRWFLPIAIVSNKIIKKQLDYRQCKVIEYTQNKINVLQFDESGELLGELVDNDDYQCNLILETR